MHVRFTDAGQATAGTVACWRVLHERTHDDGTVELAAHWFPRDTLAIRAGEYGLDPFGVDVILDVVLHEPYLDTEAVPLLMTAPTLAAARDGHLARVAAAKGRLAVPAAVAARTPAAPDPLDTIRGAYEPDLELHDLVGRHIARLRHARHGPPDGRDLKTRLRAVEATRAQRQGD